MVQSELYLPLWVSIGTGRVPRTTDELPTWESNLIWLSKLTGYDRTAMQLTKTPKLNHQMARPLARFPCRSGYGQTYR